MGPKWHFFSIWLGWRWGKTNDRHRASTLTTVVIAAGMAVLMIGLSTGKGLQEAIHQRITALQGDAQIRSYHQPNAFESTAFDWTTSKRAIPPDIKPIAMSWKQGIVAFEGSMQGAQCIGYSQWPQWLNQGLTQGSLPESADYMEVLISEDMARKLNLEVNDELQLYFQREGAQRPIMRYATLSGLFNTHMQEWDGQWLITHLSHMQLIQQLDSHQVGGLILHGEQVQTEQAMASIRGLLPMNLDLYQPQQDYPQLYQWLELFDTNTAVLASILIIIAAFNAAVVVFVLVVARAKHIAILRTMGMSARQINWAFVGHLGRDVAKGLLWGNLIGLGLLYAQFQFQILELDPVTYYVDHVPVAWDWWSFFMANLLVFTTVTVTAWLPSRILAKIRPADVLRMS
jgi:lipoprotein-releasing system permease protein